MNSLTRHIKGGIDCCTALNLKNPYTVKDAFAHITHWKANVVRSSRRQSRMVEERELNITQGNHLVYNRWHDHFPQKVLALAWQWQIHQDVLAAL